MKKHFLFFLFFLISLPVVFAYQWEIRDVPGKEIPCTEEGCTVLLDTAQEFAKYQVYHIHEISGNLVHNIIRMEYYDMPPFEICRKAIHMGEDNPRIFDVSVTKNGEQIAFEPYLDFEGEDRKIAYFPCYIAQSNDTIVFDFYTGDKIKEVNEKFLFLNLSKSEFLYPFDKYELTSWSSLDQVYYNRVDKLILPNSFVPIENKTSNFCPFYLKIGMFTGENKTWLMNMMWISEMEVFEGGSKGNFISEDNKRIVIWPTLSSGPFEDIKPINEARYNLSESDWIDIHDWRTGCYLDVEYKRTSIIKYFFFISTILIILSSIYFLWVSKKDSPFSKKIYNLFSATFIIWSFQEGLNTLTPLIRPTGITLFDLTFFIPLVFLIPVLIYKLCKRYLVPLFKKINLSKKDFIIYFLIIPAILILIFLIPNNITNLFKLDMNNSSFFTIILSNYAHQNFGHLISNLIAYFLLISLILNIEPNKKEFYWFSLFAFLIFPFLIFPITKFFLNIFNITNFPPTLGFSGIAVLFNGYFIYSLHKYLKVNAFKNLKLRFIFFLLIFNVTIWAFYNNLYLAVASCIILLLLFLDNLSGIKNVFIFIRHRIYNQKGNKEKLNWKNFILLIFFLIPLVSLIALLPKELITPAGVVNTPVHFFSLLIGVFLPYLYEVIKSRLT